ncbi:hypothetical protein [Rothia nasimurium]|nr:hypothetical protein [Rothia nasimurium]
MTDGCPVMTDALAMLTNNTSLGQGLGSGNGGAGHLYGGSF